MTRFLMAGLAYAVTAGVLAGCGSSETVTQGSAEQRYEHAKTLFDDGQYLEALDEFKVVTLQYSGSTYASDAQFYMGECRYNRTEYLLAAFEYLQLRKNYPASPRVTEAQYKLAMSYYMLSPKINLDQQYTRKAIEEFQSFVEYYPANEHVADSDAKIRELTSKLARKQIQTARLYVTMGLLKAALFYYNDVIERYHDTEFGPLAYIEEAEFLVQKKKFKDAGGIIRKFIDLYPNNVLRGRADQLEEEISTGLRNSPPGGSAGQAGATSDQKPDTAARTDR